VSQAGRATLALRQLGDRLASTTGLEAVIDTSLESIDDLLGHGSSLLLVYQPELDRLVTLATRGYDSGGVGSEVVLGEGVIGMAAARQRSMRIGNLQRMLSYARTVQRSATGDSAGSREIRLPGLADAGSQMAAPLIAGGVLLGVLAVESRTEVAYDEHDENVFSVAAHLVASALEREQLSNTDALPPDAGVAPPTTPRPTEPQPAPSAPATPEPVVIRHYAVDGSTFLDDDYVIKGVAGRLLWKLISDYSTTGRTAFTNREVKLDPVLGLPPYRDNFESRLVLLKRRLEERNAPLRITSTGRGRFELLVTNAVALHHIEA
jgi:adenylate cyclase